MKRNIAACLGLLVLATVSLPAWAGYAPLAAGLFHTCGLTPAGGAWCWGNNLSGQLGDGTQTDRHVPVRVTGLGSGIVALAAGDFHSCALTTSGAMLCWGDNRNGQVGDGTTAARRLTPVLLGANVQAITAGLVHTCAVTTTGAAYCWGDNSYGQLGDGTTTTRLSPVLVIGLGSGVVAIAAGEYHTCALTTAGAVRCWGRNRYGQLGDGTTTQRLTSGSVSGLGSGVQAITAGDDYTCALTTGGAALCWGDNNFGQLGDGSFYVDHYTPGVVFGLGSGVQAITAGDYHACALTTDGAALCWGNNGNGRLGDGTLTGRLTPVPVVGLGSGVSTIEAGNHHTCARLEATGELGCWGLNNYGELGDGTTTQRLTPYQVLLPLAAVQNENDFDGDGRSDVFWRNTSTGVNAIWKSANSATPQTVSGVSNLSWKVVGIGDFNGDGKDDVLWRNTSTGANSIWRSANSSTYQAMTGVTDLAWQIVGVGDFDGDGKDDVLWRNTSTGANTIWRSANSSAYQAMTAVTGLAWKIVGVGDFNGDGKDDVLWRNTSTGANTIWRSANSATLQAMTGITDLAWKIVGVGDFNGDGNDDVFWRNSSTGANAIWKSGNASSQQGVTGVTNQDWHVVGVGDYNGDSVSDVLWRNVATGDNVVWRSASAAMQQAVGSLATSWAAVP